MYIVRNDKIQPSWLLYWPFSSNLPERPPLSDSGDCECVGARRIAWENASACTNPRALNNVRNKHSIMQISTN